MTYRSKMTTKEPKAQRRRGAVSQRVFRAWQSMRRWSVDRWIALLSALISLCVLTYQIKQGTADQRYKRLSVQPHINLSFLFNDEGSGWRMGNSGPGPAQVRWFAVSVDGKPQRDWDQFADSLGIPKGVSYRFTVPYPGTLIPPGPGPRLFWIDAGPEADILVKNYQRVIPELCYCSLYEECWRVSTLKGGPRNASCDAHQPQTMFGPPPFRTPSDAPKTSGN